MRTSADDVQVLRHRLAQGLTQVLLEFRQAVEVRGQILCFAHADDRLAVYLGHVQTILATGVHAYDSATRSWRHFCDADDLHGFLLACVEPFDEQSLRLALYRSSPQRIVEDIALALDLSRAEPAGRADASLAMLLSTVSTAAYPRLAPTVRLCASSMAATKQGSNPQGLQSADGLVESCEQTIRHWTPLVGGDTDFAALPDVVL